MIGLWSRRLWPYVALVALVAVGMLVVAGLSTRHQRAALATAHRATAAAVDTVRITETIYRRDTILARRAVSVYRTRRDTVLLRLTDTVLVKDALADADTALARDSTALAAADTALAAHWRLEGALRGELAASERLRAGARLTSEGALRYDPLAHVPAVAARVSVRVIGGWRLGVEGQYRLVAGERPIAYVALSHPLW